MAEVNPLLAIVGEAHPLLEELKAATASLQAYTATAQDYEALAAAEKAKVDDLMVQLNTYATEFVQAYLAREAGS